MVARFPAVFLASILLVTGCRKDTAKPGPAGASRPANGAAPASANAMLATPVFSPLTLRGSTIALTPDEMTVIVADEDHEALFLVPAAFTDTTGARVVPLPGPPGELVVFGEQVFVTVRTLPTAASRAARD
ncbi:MAG TPA: hypothetical protein VGQ57_04135, partial [Polyangiaceae bacterium]|nr:hypothetical protein [Polyangiaceae bacterium]